MAQTISLCKLLIHLYNASTEMFMTAGGWNLTYNWLSDGVEAKNWPLVTELVDLLLICPVDINRLKSNFCPKLIKTLSKDPSAIEDVRVLACKLVDQWLRIVRGNDSTNSVNTSQNSVAATSSNSDSVIENNIKNEPSNSDTHLPVYKITIRDGKEVLAEISGSQRMSEEALEEGSSTGTEEINQEVESLEDEVDDHIENDDDDDEDYNIKPVRIRKKPTVTKSKKQSSIKKPAKVGGTKKKERESTDSGSSASKSPSHQRDVVKPTQKKTKSEQQSVKINIKSNAKSKNTTAVDDKKNDIDSAKCNIANTITEKLGSSKPKEKLSLSLKTKDRKLTTDKDKSHGKNDIKDKNKFESNEKAKKKMDQLDSLTDKEKESLSKFITPPISKLGKIPKKSSANKEEKQSEEKNRTLKEESVDNKHDVKKVVDSKKAAEIKRPEKKYSISIEPKRSLPNEPRPKTVKPFHSKFRSTGLEEEVKPPSSKYMPKKALSPSPVSLPDKKLVKRTSPPPPDIGISEKRIKLDSPTEDKKPTEKIGGIKLIPPKPKR